MTVACLVDEMGNKKIENVRKAIVSKYTSLLYEIQTNLTVVIFLGTTGKIQ